MEGAEFKAANGVGPTDLATVTAIDGGEAEFIPADSGGRAGEEPAVDLQVGGDLVEVVGDEW